MSVVGGFLGFLWQTFLLLAPMLLLGLFLSGVMHVFISRDGILRWFRHDGLKTVATSAAIGVPMPLCSCSVVPVVAEMRRKGASSSACMSFLITAPETGADSILVTNAFFGPIVAVVRPVVSFVTAVVSGLCCIGMTRDSDIVPDRLERTSLREDLAHDDCEHDHDHKHASLYLDRDDCYVSLRELGRFFLNWLSSLTSYFRRVKSIELTSAAELADGVPQRRGNDLWVVVKHVFKYGFVEVADEILFALLVGITLGGLLYFVIPSDLMAHEYAQWFAYPVMLLIGVPLYICASASTPIAAALVAKGVSPGAALVFLMTGPATNTGTIAIIVSQFGPRFTTIYVVGVIAVTVVLGVAIDLALLTMGISIAVNLDASDSATILALQWGGAVGLAALIIWRFKEGAAHRGFEDLMVNLRPVGRRVAEYLRR